MSEDKDYSDIFNNINSHLAKNKKLYFAFVDIEKASGRVPRKVIWWDMRKLGIKEWIVRFVQAMYNNTRSRVRVNNTYSDEFGVKVGVHQGSVVLTASQNFKLLDIVDVEDRRRHGKIRSTMISDTGSYQGQIPQTGWSGERNSEQA